MAKFGNFVTSKNLPITEDERTAWKKQLMKMVKRNYVLENFVEGEEVYDENNDIPQFGIKLVPPTNKTIQFKDSNGNRFWLDGIWMFVNKHSGVLQERDLTTGQIKIDKENAPEFQYSLTIRPLGIMKRKYQKNEQRITTRCPYDFGNEIRKDFANDKYFELC